MNGTEPHLDDVAALYALGALDERERRDVERHVAECDRCARQLGEAERDVTLVAASQPQYAAPAALQRRVARALQPATVATWPAAVAAALLVGLLPAAYFWQQDRAMHAVMAADSQALSRLATTPHRSATFSPLPGGSTASVMYGRDGSWYVIVVADSAKALSVAWMHDGRRTMLGTAAPHGDVAMLYLPSSHRMDRLALMDGDTVVAEAQLAY
jgi:anti-sigma-K factor RskA